MVTIPADTLKPIADAGIDTLRLNCYTPAHTLGTPLTSQGPEFRYSWVMVGTPLDTLGRDRTFFVDDSPRRLLPPGRYQRKQWLRYHRRNPSAAGIGYTFYPNRSAVRF